MPKENSHCRKPDCIYHPDKFFKLFRFSWLRCIKCKHFVSRDNYKSTKKNK